MLPKYGPHPLKKQQQQQKKKLTFNHCAILGNCAKGTQQLSEPIPQLYPHFH